MTPHDLVLHHFEFPFPLREYQSDAVNELAPLDRTGLYLEPGLGKTAVSTFCALYKLIMGQAETVLAVMPPLLVDQWAAWLSKIKMKEGRQPTIHKYAGPPAKRKEIGFKTDFMLSGVQLFKQDIERFNDELGGKNIHVILDEAQCIKNVDSNNYRVYRDFVEFNTHQLLTGTPLNVPVDAYAYIKLVSPGTYRNLLHFTNAHVTEIDIFKAPTAYKDLDILTENLLINAVRKTKEDVLKDLPECVVSTVEYNLVPAHYKLYVTLANNKLLELPDGGKIDATQVSALFHALGQIVCQWSYFGQDEKLKAKAYSLVEEVLDELGSKKLIVFTNYKRTNQEMVRRFGCPGIWSEVSHDEKQAGLKRFLNDDKCRLITMNMVAGGVGLDGFQHVCTDALYLEPPVTPAHLTQSLSRVHREGQKHSVSVRLGVALGTLQRSRVDVLTDKESLIAPIQVSKAYLTPEEVRHMVFGGSV